MSKTLAESAAEILRASMGAPKDPMLSMGADAEDLGGSSNENPAGDAVGMNAAAKVKVAPKPGQSGAPAEPIKKGAPPAEQVIDEKGLVREEDEVELTEEELDAYLETLSEEELEALANQIDEDDEEVGQIDEMGSKPTTGKKGKVPMPMDIKQVVKEDEQIDEAYPPMHNVTDMKGKIVGTHSADRGFVPSRNSGLKPHPTTIPNGHKIDRSTNLRAAPQQRLQALASRPKMNMKEMVRDNMGSMKEDVDALFNGESLSEEFRDKATTIFESAVKSRVEVVLEQVIAKNDEYLAEVAAGIEDELTEKVDEYLNYVVEQWMQENALAVNSGLRAELAEDFINGLKNLFTEHYIEIPEDKVNVVDELADKVLDLESALEEACSNAEALIAELNESKKNNSINDFCEGLTQVQREKMRSLAEGVEFTSEGDFVKKLAMIRESYFPTKSNVKIAEKKILSETSEENSEVETGTVMDYYVKAISKTVPKTGE